MSLRRIFKNSRVYCMLFLFYSPVFESSTLTNFFHCLPIIDVVLAFIVYWGIVLFGYDTYVSPPHSLSHFFSSFLYTLAILLMSPHTDVKQPSYFPDTAPGFPSSLLTQTQAHLPNLPNETLLLFISPHTFSIRSALALLAQGVSRDPFSGSPRLALTKHMIPETHTHHSVPCSLTYVSHHHSRKHHICACTHNVRGVCRNTTLLLFSFSPGVGLLHIQISLPPPGVDLAANPLWRTKKLGAKPSLQRQVTLAHGWD